MGILRANLVSEWRRALVSELATAFPRARVTSGRRQGVNRSETPWITVFFAGYRELADRVVVAQPLMIIRYWPPRPEIPSSDTPADPTELEQAAVDLLELLQDRQAQIEAASDDLWYFRVESVTIDEDPEEWGVEARLVGFARNVAVLS
jgi:hypothetical protein